MFKRKMGTSMLKHGHNLLCLLSKTTPVSCIYHHTFLPFWLTGRTWNFYNQLKKGLRTHFLVVYQGSLCPKTGQQELNEFKMYPCVITTALKECSTPTTSSDQPQKRNPLQPCCVPMCCQDFRTLWAYIVKLFRKLTNPGVNMTRQGKFYRWSTSTAFSRCHVEKPYMPISILDSIWSSTS